jgi:putative nucleotidyltransferase with HDIG domain
MPSEYQKYFQTLSDVAKAIHSGTRTEDIIQAIVTHTTDLLTAKGSIFWILNRKDQRIETKISHGFPYRNLLRVDYEALKTVFRLDPGTRSFIQDARKDPKIPDLDPLGKRWVVSVYGVSVDIAPPYSGLLAVYFSRKQVPGPPETDFLMALAEHGAIALHKAIRYDERMLTAFRQTVEGLVMALEAKDPTTHGHSLRVAFLARMTAQKMNLSEQQIEQVYHAALLHDIGKIGMTDRILERLGTLSRREMLEIRRHPEIGSQILKPLVFLNDLVPLILHHHEDYDGSGYPDGLEGEDIPLGARILTVCDAFETMLSGRRNITPLSLERALEQLGRANSTKFDPRVTRSLVEAISDQPDSLLSFFKLPPVFPEMLQSSYETGVEENKSGSDSSPWRNIMPTSF